MQLALTVNKILALGTILSQIFILAVVFSLLAFRKRRSGFLEFCKKYTLHIGFIVSLGALAVSLFYSNIIGYPACTLCWWQRIFMYPQVIIFGIALVRKEKMVIDYALALSIIGALVALYHNYISLGGIDIFPCAATAEAISCTQRFVSEFGYITIPLMSLTAFLVIIVSAINYRVYKK